MSSLPCRIAFVPGTTARPSVTSEIFDASLKAGRLTARRFSPGAAARRSVSSGVDAREVSASWAMVGPSWWRKLSRRSKSAERSPRRAAEAAAVSRASWMKRTTSALFAASWLKILSELTLRSRIVRFCFARMASTLRSSSSDGAPSRIAWFRSWALPASAVPNSLMIPEKRSR